MASSSPGVLSSITSDSFRYDYPGITITVMVRPPLTAAERDRGRRLGALLRAARGNRPPAEVAAASGVSLEALRKIESGRVPTPAFFTVAALAAALDVPLDELVAAVTPSEDTAVATALTA
jgi:transcriptional regulator with XRE-family HTH domain